MYVVFALLASPSFFCRCCWCVYCVAVSCIVLLFFICPYCFGGGSVVESLFISRNHVTHFGVKVIPVLIMVLCFVCNRLSVFVCLKVFIDICILLVETRYLSFCCLFKDICRFFFVMKLIACTCVWIDACKQVYMNECKDVYVCTYVWICMYLYVYHHYGGKSCSVPDSTVVRRCSIEDSLGSPISPWISTIHHQVCGPLYAYSNPHIYRSLHVYLSAPRRQISSAAEVEASDVSISVSGWDCSSIYVSIIAFKDRT